MRGPPNERSKELDPHNPPHTLLHEAHTQIPLRGKTVQVFLGAPDGHTAFTISLHLDVSFAMTSRALRNCRSTALDIHPILIPKPPHMQPTRNLPSSYFLTWPTPSSSPCTLAFSCTTWTACDSVRTLWAPQSKSTRVHTSPPLIHQYELFKRYIKYTQYYQ